MRKDKKDQYYFSHDANAQDDPKCMNLIDKLGMEGYGIFWAIIEKLRSEKDYRLPIDICASYARRWATTKETIESVVNDFGLFKYEDNYFYSQRLRDWMNGKSEMQREKANKRWATKKKKEVIVGVALTKEQQEKGAVFGESENVEYPISQCRYIVMQDTNWHSKLKFSETDMNAFMDHLEKNGEFQKNPKKFKYHFVSWLSKRKNNKDVVKPLNFQNEQKREQYKGTPT